MANTYSRGIFKADDDDYTMKAILIQSTSSPARASKTSSWKITLNMTLI